MNTTNPIHEYDVSLPNGIRVRTLDEGQGPVALCSHGNPDNADEYAPLIRLLRGQFRCIAPDLPGYGRRERSYPLPGDFDYSVRAQVKFLESFLDQLQIHEPLTLVVHDIGGIMGGTTSGSAEWIAVHKHRGLSQASLVQPCLSLGESIYIG